LYCFEVPTGYNNCQDGVMNGTETGVDSGGDCAAACIPSSSSCQTLLEAAPGLPSDVYSIDPDGPGGDAPFDVYCDMVTDGGGWTLLASFVNTDGSINWTRPNAGATTADGIQNWVNPTTFGTIATRTTADFKSQAFNTLDGRDLMLTDAYGFLSFDGVLGCQSVLDHASTYSACQTDPLVEPGSPRVDSDSASYESNSVLMFFSRDGNAGGSCAFTGNHNDSSILAVSGTGCGTMGAGQWGTNYNSGMDWHLRIDESTVCVTPACEAGCGLWEGRPMVTSTSHNNNAGVHDLSTYGMLWMR